MIEELENEREREKLERVGAKAMSDKDLIKLIISTGTNSHSLDEIADNILVLLDKDEDIDINRLRLIPGIGKAKASSLVASLEIGRRKNKRKPKPILSPQDIFSEIRHFSSRDQEQLIVLCLTGAHEIIDIKVATVGLLDRTVVHPREVFTYPIRERAAAIAIAHNHPSGRLIPSEEDKNVTKRIVSCGKLLGIKVIDHIIFSDSAYYSFLEHDELR